MPIKLSFLSRLFAIVCMSGVSITMCGLIIGTSVMSSVDESSSRDVTSQKKSLEIAGLLMELGSTLSLGSVSCFIFSLFKDQLDFETNEKLTHFRCVLCKNYSSNPYLRCAINPSLPPNCSDERVRYSSF